MDSPRPHPNAHPFAFLCRTPGPNPYQEEQTRKVRVLARTPRRSLIPKKGATYYSFRGPQQTVCACPSLHSTLSMSDFLKKSSRASFSKILPRSFYFFLVVCPDVCTHPVADVVRTARRVVPPAPPGSSRRITTKCSIRNHCAVGRFDG